MTFLSVALAVPDDVRDIRGPVPLPEWWRWPLAIGVSALLALAVVLLVRGLRERRARGLSPHERARAALLLAEAHAREGRSHEWAEVVAETMRAALVTRLGVEILPQTTSELARSTSPSVLPESPRIIELLETCDLARFAMASLDVAALVDRTAVARELVESLFAPPPPASINASASQPAVP